MHYILRISLLKIRVFKTVICTVIFIFILKDLQAHLHPYLITTTTIAIIIITMATIIIIVILTTIVPIIIFIIAIKIIITIIIIISFSIIMNIITIITIATITANIIILFSSISPRHSHTIIKTITFVIPTTLKTSILNFNQHHI